MTYLPVTKVSTRSQDGPDRDGFSRLRTSSPYPLFESYMVNDDQPLLWETLITGSASSTYIRNESSVRMEVGATAGDQVIRQTYEYFRYQPGKSQLITMSATLGTTDGTKRVGYYDDTDGLIFEVSDQPYVVLRSSASGIVEEERIPQSMWNVDRLDGTGPSGYDIDFTKIQLFIMDMQWLGAGRVRYGVMLGGDIIYCHYFEAANVIDKVIIQSGSLPCRCELISDGINASSMKQTCAVVISEGGIKRKGTLRSVDTGTVDVPVTATPETVLSFRLKQTHRRGIIYPQDIFMTQTSNNSVLYYQVILRAIPSGAMTWESVDDHSGVEVSRSRVQVTGGIIVGSGYIQTRGDSASFDDFENVLPVCSDYAGESFMFTIVCTAMGGSLPASVAMQFRELT